MTRHLDHDDLLALAESGAPSRADAHAHLARCAACRKELADLCALLAELREAQVPEPSPLFWEHLSSRVRQAIDAEAPAPTGPHAAPRGWTRWLGWNRGFAAAAAAVALLMVLAWPFAPGRQPATPEGERAGATGAVEQDRELPAEGEDWTLIAEAVDELDYDDVRALGASLSGPAELAVLDLDADERRALANALRDEIARLSPASAGTL